MPPSGFNKKAINGLLEFVKGNYENTIKKYGKLNLSEKAQLGNAIIDMENNINNILINLKLELPEYAIKGLTIFIIENYADLIKEIQEGKKDEGNAMQAEITDISNYLLKFTIHEKK